MALVLTEEQSLLKETANEFLQKNAPIILKNCLLTIIIIMALQCQYGEIT